MPAPSSRPDAFEEDEAPPRAFEEISREIFNLIPPRAEAFERPTYERPYGLHRPVDIDKAMLEALYPRPGEPEPIEDLAIKDDPAIEGDPAAENLATDKPATSGMAGTAGIEPPRPADPNGGAGRHDPADPLQIRPGASASAPSMTGEHLAAFELRAAGPRLSSTDPEPGGPKLSDPKLSDPKLSDPKLIDPKPVAKEPAADTATGTAQPAAMATAPAGIKPLADGPDLARLAIDEHGHLCWDGKPVEVRRQLVMSRAQIACAGVVAVLVLVAALGATIQGAAAAHDWACSRGLVESLCGAPGTYPAARGLEIPS